MAGVIGKRLRLTTSRKPSYRRGGVAIGNLNAPTYIERDDVTLDQALAIVRDPNIAIAFEDEDGEINVLTEEEREAIAEGLETEIEARRVEETVSTPAPQPDATEPDLPDMAAFLTNTAEPQGEGLTPGTEASQAGGPDATAADSTASAGGAVPTEPTAQPAPAAPEPTAPPPPAPKQRGKAKAKTA